MTTKDKSKKRVYEKRWWMWLIAIATTVALYDFQWHVRNRWDIVGLLEGVATAAGLAVVLSSWRGRVVNGFLLVASCLCLLKILRDAQGH